MSFLRYSMTKNVVTLKSGQRSLRVIESVTIRLTFRWHGVYIYETAHVVPPSADDMLRRPLAALVTAPVGRCRCDDLRDSKSAAAQPTELVHPRLGNSNNSINSRPTQRVRDYLLHLRLLCTYRRTIIYSCIPLGIYRRP